MSLYDEIGGDTIAEAIREFYTQAVVDPLIGHFFFDVQIEELIAKQIAFSERLLGRKDSSATETRSLKAVHHPLKIHSVHFARRQKLFASVLEEVGVEEHARKAWLEREAQLKALIVSPANYDCR